MLNENIKICEFESINKCQGKNSAGHADTIRSISDGYCAKLSGYGSREFNFYKEHSENGLKQLDKFISKFDGSCIDPKYGKRYTIMKNIKEGFEEPWEMDIKIGLRTASLNELKDRMGTFRGALYKYRHYMLDNYFTISRTYGFRVENFSKEKKYQNLYSKNMRPSHVFKMYFQHDDSGKILKNFIKKIEEFYNVIMMDEFDRYNMIGSSILFVYDKKNAINHNYDINIKMIDFDHSSIRDISKLPQNNIHYLHVNEYRYGILTLMKELKHYLIDVNPNKSLFTKYTKKTRKYTKNKKDRQNIINTIKFFSNKFD